MREEDLRTLLTRYVAGDGPVPAPRSLRGRATRRRLAPVGVATVALVVAGALMVPQFTTRPATPVPAASPSVTPEVSPSPTRTPGRTPTPRLSCTEIKDAWRAAVVSKAELPSGLGREPRIVAFLEEAVVAGGIIDGQLVARAFPNGLAGDSYELVRLDPRVRLTVLEATERRAVYGEFEQDRSSFSIRLFVKDGPEAEARPLLAWTSGGGNVFWHSPFPVDGDKLRWVARTETPDAPFSGGPLALMELDLTEPVPTPRVALELEAISWDRGGDRTFVFTRGLEQRAFDRVTLQEVWRRTLPEEVTNVRGWNREDLVLFSPLHEPVPEEIWVHDLATGESRLVYTGFYSQVTMSGRLAIFLRGPRVILVDLDSGNSILLMDDNPPGTQHLPGAPDLVGQYLRRWADGSSGNPGTLVRLDTLPQSIPEC